jgi:hypothetical protein
LKTGEGQRLSPVFASSTATGRPIQRYSMHGR